MIREFSLALALAVTGQTAFAGCAGQEDTCETPMGAYHIELPDADNAPMVVFLHGYGGSGSGTMRNRAMVEPLLERGYAVMAPEGLERPDRGALYWPSGWCRFGVPDPPAETAWDLPGPATPFECVSRDFHDRTGDRVLVDAALFHSRIARRFG